MATWSARVVETPEPMAVEFEKPALAPWPSDVALAAVQLWNRLLERIEKWRLPSSWPEPRGPQKRKWTPPPRHAFLNATLKE